MKSVGVVIIGRNEGQRLVRCLESVARSGVPAVYVDSGSTDGSVDRARSLGAAVVELDRSEPFTAARGRNAGFHHLLRLHPEMAFVQFVDGDCELNGDWLDTARTYLSVHPQVAIVGGRRRERYPQHSPYNRLCDMEWDTPVGEASECGGDTMMRVDAFRDVGGFNGRLIAGEEPELCVRLRARGWKIVRLDAEMTLHDAAMTRFGQWWRKTTRAGYAYAEAVVMHGAPPERHWVKKSRSAWFWGGVVPLLAFGLAWPTKGLSLLLLLGYSVLWAKIYRYGRQRGRSAADSRLYAAACTFAKIPETVGQVRYWRTRLSGGRGELIEYKQVGTV